jgi:hypothetical protein
MKTALLLSASFTLLGVSLAAQDRSLWDQDLNTVGYSRPDDQRNRTYLLAIEHRVVFLDEKTIAITFLSQNDTIGLTTAQQPGAPYVIKSAFVDVASGVIQKTMTWGNATLEFKLAATDAGQFAVMDRSGITLYSETLEQIAHVKHQSDSVATEGPPPNRKMFPDSNNNYWLLEPSSTGKTLVAVHSGGFTAMVRRYSATNLELLSEFKQPSFFSSSASDERFAYTKFDAPGRRIATLYIRPLTGDMSDVHKVDVQNCSAPDFISDELLMVTGTCSYLFLIDTNGRKVAERRLDQTISLGPLPFRNGQRMASRPVPSRNGQRFAVTEFQLAEGSSWRDIGPSSKDVRIVVYDVAGLTSVFSLPQTRPVSVLGYALSPDGSLLAVLRDNKLTLYRIGGSAPLANQD